MTTDRDLDRQLAGWLDERATSITPDGLLARSLARVDATRQRPRWVVGDRLPSGSAWGRAVVPAWAILLLILLAAVAAVATGARLFLLPVPATIVDASPSPFAADMSIAPSAGPTVFPTPDNAVAPQPGMFASLADFLAASDTVAWARTEVPGAIYRSANTGRTWTEVRSGTWNGTTGATAFIDAQTMYAASDGPQATIAATHDGGATWVETTLDLPSTDTGPVFSFESSSSGFATFFDTAPGSPLRVYGTTDGGLTWTGPKNGTVPHMAASSDKLEPPIGGFLWQSAGKADNKPFDNRFFLSADGGATWTQYTFPIGTLAPKDALKEIAGIAREDNGRILLSINVDSGRNPTPIPEAIYESGADTATWRLVQAMPPGGNALTVLSPTEWVLFSTAPSEVRSTVDAGAHWRTTTPSISLYYASGYFATPNTGWATQDCHPSWGVVGLCDGKTAGLVLGVTTDGGATWTQVGG